MKKTAFKLTQSEKEEMLATLGRLSRSSDEGQGTRKVVPFGRRAGDEKLLADVHDVADDYGLPASFFEYFEFKAD
jgi:hypothetical protein